jgi:hypothetical protein
MPASRRGNLIPPVLLPLIAAAAASCTVLQAPVVRPSIASQDIRQIVSGRLEIKAAPITKAEEYWELFDDNAQP